jgi:hypothetical protein
MNRRRLVFIALLASSLGATVVALRGSGAARPVLSTPVVGAIDSLTMQAALRYQQAQPRHWRYVMLRQ